VGITRFYRFSDNGTMRYAVEREGVCHLVEGDVFANWREGAAIAMPKELLAPVVPSKIVAIGLNYKDHAAEQGKPVPAEPVMFLKPSTAVIGPGERVVIPADVGRVDHEAELGIVIGRRATRVREQEALHYVLGAVCVNDVTARDLQRKDGRYTRAKGFDTFAPLGPCVATGLPLDDLEVEGWVNGEKRQGSSTRQLIFSVARLVEYVSAIMTLLPGDIISTGTPAGIGSLQPGDRVTIKVGGVGELTNPVVAEQAISVQQSALGVDGLVTH
jgi:2-keto-4-pentenoate hydratase/2-oxohepta-3-ene-1,7-dioic acid hydratase in catechol pathway